MPVHSPIAAINSIIPKISITENSAISIDTPKPNHESIGELANCGATPKIVADSLRRIKAIHQAGY
ncbi:MAG: hypothetical protein ACM3UY_05745 [Methanocella sp.]